MLASACILWIAMPQYQTFNPENYETIPPVSHIKCLCSQNDKGIVSCSYDKEEIEEIPSLSNNKKYN